MAVERPRAKPARPLTRSKRLRAAVIVSVLSLSLGALQLRSGVGLFRTANAQALPPAIPILLYVVDSTGDGNLVGPSTSCDDGTGHCTLRAAIEASNLDSLFDAISFNIPTTDPGYSGGTWTINLPRALPDVSDATNISGPGADKLVVQRSKATGTPNFRVFKVTTSGTVSFSGMTITNGDAGIVAGPGDFGGGIENYNAGTVNLTNCAVSANYSTGILGSPGEGGGIANRAGGTINITTSTINDNAGDFGGGIYNGTSGTVNITNSTLDHNSAATGGGIYNFGVINITGSTLTVNGASLDGGGIYNYVGTVNIASSTIGPTNVAFQNGGGIYNDAYGTVKIANSTIFENNTQGVYFAENKGGGIYNATTLSVTNSTIAGNFVQPSNSPGDLAFGGGIYNDGAGSATIKSSIIATNGFAVAGEGPDVYGAFASQGYNLIGATDGSTGFTAFTDLTGSGIGPADPNFEFDSYGSVLKNNGGPTNTLALLCGSAAIDQGSSNGLTGTLSTDQRGSGFLRTLDDPAVTNPDDGTDIGAFEVQQPCGGPTCNDVIFSQNFDSVTAPALPAGWTATNPDVPFPNWATSSATPDIAPNDAFISDPAKESDARLDSPVISIPSATAKLIFRSEYDLYQNQTLRSWDGGVLEISINGGAFMDIVEAGGSFVTGAYNELISQLADNPIGVSRQAWTGNSNGYVTTMANLPPSAAGQNIQLRWRLGSVATSPGASGWSIDTISVVACVSPTPTPSNTPMVPTATSTATLTPTRTQTPTTTATNGPTGSPTKTTVQTPTLTATATPNPFPCWDDVDHSGRPPDVSTDVVYVARTLLTLPPVPPSFRSLEPFIFPDILIVTSVNALGIRCDVDRNGTVDVATDIVYIARRLLGLPPVPQRFRLADPTIPPDTFISANIDALCP